MGLRTCLLAILILVTGAEMVYGQTSCLPKNNSLQMLSQIDLTVDSDSVHRLTSDTGNTVRDTRVNLKSSFKTADGKLNLRVQWDEDFSGVSLPFNVYAVMILIDGKIVNWSDYTEHCTDVGISLYPGAVLSIPPIEIGSVGLASVQIMLWGRVL